MADRHPYVPGPGGLIKVLNHFKKSFPSSVTAETLKKLGYAPKNETYILNVLRFLNLINEEGNKNAEAAKDFNLHEEAAFQAAFSKRVATAYKDLFDLHGDGAWNLNADQLIAFFRQTDGTTDLVGNRQATTFRLLAGYAGHGEIAAPKTTAPKKAKSPSVVKKSVPAGKAGAENVPAAALSTTSDKGNGIGLTVRIEINLPADGDQATYDNIFKSIRQNLLNG